MNQTRQQAERARKAFLKLSTSADRTAILNDVAAAIGKNATTIFAANNKDLAEAKGLLAEPLYKRLILNESKLRDVVDGITQIAKMDDPVGRVLEETELDEDLILRKVQTPIGVIAAIFESRPDVVPQIAALAIRSGNAVLLKGGREAAETNAALGDSIREALDKHGVPDAVQLVSTREQIAEFLKMDDLISLVIPFSATPTASAMFTLMSSRMLIKRSGSPSIPRRNTPPCVMLPKHCSYIPNSPAGKRCSKPWRQPGSNCGTRVLDPSIWTTS